MATVMMKTHLIVTDQYDEYGTRWVRPLSTVEPEFNGEGTLTFAIISNKGRMEFKTFDVNYVQRQAQKFTQPKGRGAKTTDKCYIYVKTKGGTETLIGVVQHDHIRKYAPMYDPVEI
jgi:hypothetical protein